MMTMVKPMAINKALLLGVRLTAVKSPIQVFTASTMHTGKANKNGVRNFKIFMARNIKNKVQVQATGDDSLNT